MRQIQVLILFFSNTYYDTKWIKTLQDNCPVTVKVGTILIWSLTHIRPMLYCLEKLIDSCPYASLEVVKTNVFRSLSLRYFKSFSLWCCITLPNVHNNLLSDFYLISWVRNEYKHDNHGLHYQHGDRNLKMSYNSLCPPRYVSAARTWLISTNPDTRHAHIVTAVWEWLVSWYNHFRIYTSTCHWCIFIVKQI